MPPNCTLKMVWFYVVYSLPQLKKKKEKKYKNKTHLCFLRGEKSFITAVFMIARNWKQSKCPSKVNG